jgi:flagellar biogenesis protein FliO
MATGVVLLALVAGTWLLRRGVLAWPALGRARAQGLCVETAFSLGERRSLAVVSVEGRRLLLGLTPSSISLIAELPREAPSFGATLDRRTATGDSA